ncbi:MAG TPA: glycosyltransferase family 4 protein [Candidatus Acidoferrales bacterium]|nr:glycosyltransferase family 4 protein [Candidatus Acidoferrales bacterium]
MAQRLALTLLRRADLIVVDNSALRDDLAHLGFDRENIFVCSMGVSLPAPTPPVDLQDYDACFLGRVHPAKGIFDLIEIWDAVRRMRPVARCAVIGDDSDLKGPIADEIARRGLEKHLDFLGFLPQREVSETFARSKLFVLPSREEGWGIAIAEAMAAGLPAILYDLPAFRNLYTSGVEKIPCFSTAAYAHAIVRLLEDPSRRESLSREAKLLSATFSWDETTGREFDCLRALLH